MAIASPTAARPLQMEADDLKSRMGSGAPVTVLDARAPKAWNASDIKIRGSLPS
jgi:hypothetical protein